MIDFLKQKVTYFHVFVFASIYLIILSFQGFDLCDEGWVLSSFQQFFNAPESISYYFLYYLNALLGGTINYFFESGGIFMFRLFNVLLILLSGFILHKIFKDFLSPLKFLIIIVFSLLISDFGVIVLDHNQLSALLIIYSIFLIKSNFVRQSNKIILLSGFFIGLSFFARITNLTMLILVLIFFIDYSYSKDLKQLFKNLFLFFTGILIAIFVMFLLMKKLGHFEIFIKNVSENVLHGAKDPHHNHNLLLMFKTYFYQGVGMIKFLLKSCFISIPFIFLIKYFDKNENLKTLFFSIYFALFIHLAYVDDLLNFSTLLLIPVLISLFIDRKNKEVIFLNLAALFIFIFLPWGSDLGAYNMGITCMYMLVFVSIIHFFRFYKSEKFKNHSAIFILFAIALFSFVPLRVYRVYHTAYFDFGARHEKIFNINHPLVNVYTTKEKMLVMNDLLQVLNKEIKPNEIVYFHESMPMLHYLTKTRPYLDNAWPWIYGPENYNNRLMKKENSNDFRPTVIRQKCQPIGGKWTVYDQTYNDTISDLNFSYNSYRTKYFEAFLKRNAYHVIWENDLYQILKTNNSKL
jgi:hypothetical protein